MGFRTQTIDFTLTYVLVPSLRRMHELRLGADVLESHVSRHPSLALPFSYGLSAAR